MEMATILSILLVIVLAAAGGIAWFLYGPGNAAGSASLKDQRPNSIDFKLPQPSAPQGPTTPSPTPSEASPAPTPADPHDPTIRLAAAVAAQLEETASLVRTIPREFHDQTAMRVGLQAIKQQLADLQAIFARSDPSRYSIHGPLLRKTAERLTSIGQDATRIGELLVQLDAHERELRQATVGLSDELNRVAQLAPYPLAVEQTATASARVLGQSAQLLARSELESFNALKFRLRVTKELRAELDQLRADLELAQSRRTTLITLLSSPELADDATWYRALSTLHTRSRAVGERATSEPTARLLADADQLQTRRTHLLDFCTPMGQGGVLLDEERLPALLAEAEAICTEVRVLWQRARAIAAAQRSTPTT